MTVLTLSRSTTRATDKRPFALARWCILVFALVLLHLALMTGEHHRDTAASPHAGLPHVSAVPATLSMISMQGHGEDDGSRSRLDGCPVRQAILPLILLLLSIVGAFLTQPPLGALAASGAVRRAPPAAPPPLAAAQRRALLQTFII
jgi:hypothetical protein